MERLDIFNNKLYLLFIVIGILFYVAFLVYTWNLTVDDSYISFRYALHLAQGYGLVWNIGEPPIEGYSNFLWVAILSAFIYLKLDPVVVSKIIGLASVGGILFYFWKFVSNLFSKKVVALLGFSIASAIFLANPATAMHTIAGLETMLYAFLMIGLMYYTYKILTLPGKKYYWLFGIFALLLSLLRFEGILITISLLILIIWLNYRKTNTLKLEKSFIIPVVSIFFIPVALYMIFRFQYFHDLIPTTYYAKSISGNIIGTAIYNLSRIYDYFLVHIVPFLFIILLTIINFKLFLKDPRIKRQYFYIIAIFIFAAIAGNIIYPFTDLSMNYADRLFYPTYIFLYLLTGISLALIFMNKDIYELNPFKKLKFSRTLLQVAVVFLVLASNIGFVHDITAWQEYEKMENTTQVSVGLALQPYSAYNYTVATDYAGAIPYYSRWNHIDMLGLNDKYIAENKRPSLDYLRQVKPDLIIIPIENGKITNEDFNPFLEYAIENNYAMIKLPWDDFVYYLNPKMERSSEISQSLSKIG